MEQALLQIADALEPLPGAKSLVLVGHGWGRWVGSYVFFDKEYGPAVEAFQAGRVTVFSLDTTDADQHTLEVGLESVAAQTGGFFARTNLFSSARSPSWPARSRATTCSSSRSPSPRPATTASRWGSTAARGT